MSNQSWGVRLWCGKAIVIASLALMGCGSTFTMTRGDSVPGARGEVSASFVKEGNSRYTVSVAHLPSPADVSPKATTYVVWVKPRNEKAETKPQSVGTLKVDAADLDGKLEFTSPYTSFDLTITPEPSGDATVPSGRDVLKVVVSAD